jgi:5-methylthioadenosine/S-adenosylhomocysteine deaminase
MPRSPIDPVSPSSSGRRSVRLSRRELLAGAGAGAAALVLEQSGLRAQAPRATTIVFSHVTVVNVDAVQDDVALVVEGDRIAAIGPTASVLEKYPGAEIYDGRGKALLPA